MRKQKVTLTIQAGDESGDMDFICEGHDFTFNPETSTFKATFVNGRDERDEDVQEIVINRENFVGRVLILLADEEEKVTISRAEYDSLQETAAILSDKDTVAELAEAEADIKAGRVTEIIVGPQSFPPLPPMIPVTVNLSRDNH